MSGFSIHTRDGEMGHVDDFYFDDESWHVRYLVVKTGPWLFGRRVLISPTALETPDWEARVLPVNLTNEQVKNSPETDLDKPVSRQHEYALSQYYGWPSYWSRAPMVSPTIPQPIAPETTGAVPPETRDAEQEARAVEEEADSHLRSVDEVTGYTIQATDREIGHVEDFFAGETDWKIRYALVDTRNWLPGRHVLISPDWIDEVDWVQQLVRVHVTAEKIENSPEYDPNEPITRGYETRLYEYYGYPYYWTGV
jgi:hypothetical protein